jgi:hypothetical protein
MALDVTVYTVEARKREETPYPATDFWTYDYEEAKAYAAREHLIVIANEYEWADSEPLDDYTEDDDGQG